MRSLIVQREIFVTTGLMPCVMLQSARHALFEPLQASLSVLNETHQGDRKKWKG